MKKFSESLQFFREILGNHVLTALLLKEIADFYLFHGKKSLGSVDDKQRSIELYEEALEMMKGVGIKDQKECILPLTNIGLCYQMQGNMEKAKEKFQASFKIAEQELAKNHKRKIYVMTQMAFWFKENGNAEEANMWKRKALKISDTLELPDHQPPNKFMLHKI